jgi:hypothetical protein
VNCVLRVWTVRNSSASCPQRLRLCAACSVTVKSDVLCVKVKSGGVYPAAGHEDPEGQYISTLSLTSTLHRGGWSSPRLSRCTAGKVTRYPSNRKLGGPQGRSGRVRKISLPPRGIDPRTVQSVATRCAGLAVPVRVCVKDNDSVIFVIQTYCVFCEVRAEFSLLFRLYFTLYFCPSVRIKSNSSHGHVT